MLHFGGRREDGCVEENVLVKGNANRFFFEKTNHGLVAILLSPKLRCDYNLYFLQSAAQ